MDVQWMRSFLGLLHCDTQPCSSNGPLNTNWPFSLDDLEGDDDLRFEFSCPFCYMEFDIGSLCSHLEEEHCFESKAAVCPVCAAKVGNDVVGHITLQHGHLFKMQRRRSHKGTSSATSSFSTIGKELPEACLQAYLEVDEEAGGKSSSAWEHHITSVESPQECELKLEVAALQAKFSQQLILSTIFGDD